MKPKSRLSLVVVTRWASEWLDLCLRGIENNSDLDNELIIVADRPSRQTLDLLQRRGLPHHVVDYAHFFVGCNLGANVATREYVGFLNDDTYMSRGWDTALEELLAPKALVALANLSPNHGHTFGYDTNARKITDFDVTAFDRYCEEHKSERVGSFCWMPLVVRREAFFDHGGFTYHRSQGHGHETQLETRMLWSKVHARTSYKSFLFHFGSTNNMDGSTDTRPCGYALICSACGVREEPVVEHANDDVSDAVNRNGYWLCANCVGKDGSPESKLELRRQHAVRCLQKGVLQA